MNNKRILSIPIVIGLLLVLATSAFAATRTQSVNPPVVGTWTMKIAKTANSPETNETMQTFSADGNYLETNNNAKAGSTGHGVWIGSGNTYLYTFQVFTSDEQGNYSGKRIISGRIRMDGPDHYTGTASADVVDLAGKVTKNAFAAAFEATRMEVVLP